MRLRLSHLIHLVVAIIGLLSINATAGVTPRVIGSSLQLQVGEVQWVPGHAEASFETVQGGGWPWSYMDKPNLGQQPEGVWLRFTLNAKQGAAGKWYLSLRWPVLDNVHLRVFYPERDEWGPMMHAGDHVQMDHRPIKDPNFVYPLELHQNEQAVLYMQIRAIELMALPMTLYDEAGYAAAKITDAAIISVLLGGMLVILLYNISLVVFTRDVAYLLYNIYLASALFYVLTISGFGQLFIWPQAPVFSHRFYGLSAALCFFTPLLFASRFLKLGRYGGWPQLVARLLMAYWATVILVILLAPKLAHYLAIETMGLVSCILTMASVINLWIRGNPSARLFAIAWSTLLIATIAHVLALDGLLPLNAWTLQGQYIGMLTEFVLLSMALAARINHERNHRIVAQQNALQASEALARERESRLHAQQQTLEVQMRNNEALEARVYERTRALEKAKQGLESANRQLTHLSITDALTQLSNRGHFDLVIDEELRRAQRNQLPLSVLWLDIDHFKRVNDTHGHPFGDECLRLVASTLRNHGQRAGDVLARYGGEEFIMAMPGADAHEAVSQAERIRLAVEQLWISHGETRQQLTLSVGVATYQPPSSCSASELLAAADAALYRAKHNGRNQVVVAEPSLNLSSNNRLNRRREADPDQQTARHALFQLDGGAVGTDDFPDDR